jgi:amino acid adenylation domain-containing protein
MKILDKKNIEDILPLTPMQQGMLFHYLKDRQSDYYFEQLCLTISGEINLTWFKQSWALVVKTNEMLRTRFKWEKMKKPLQVLLKDSPLPFIFHDFSRRNINEYDKRNLVEGIKNNDRKNKFNLNLVPFRITLCKISEVEYELIISNHHILYDGWSNGILLKEVFSFYNDLIQKKSPLKPHKHKYKEYISWIQSQDDQKRRKYWSSYLNGFGGMSEFSIKRKKRKNITDSTGNFKVRLSKVLRDQLEIFVKGYKITLASLLYGTWGILLQRYNNSEDIIFGTTVSGRSADIGGIEDIVGLFINTIPLRVQNKSGVREKIEDFLYRLNNELEHRMDYESTSLVDIKNWSGLGVQEEFFDTIVVIENYPLETVRLGKSGKFSIDSYSIFEKTHYDLTVGIMLFDEIAVEFNFNRDLFDPKRIKKLADHFTNILENILHHPGKDTRTINILSEEEKNKILCDFNKTEAEYPKDKTINGIFENQAEKNPFHTAVVFADQQLTYWELNGRSNQLAYLLKLKGVKSDTIVGIIVERSLEMLVGIMGILKGGGAYLPIDPNYPGKRIAYMLTDSNAGLLLTNRSSSRQGEKGEMWEGETAFLEQIDETCYNSTCADKFFPPGSLAYIIYTSGTTGKPKGVMVNHSSVLNRLFWICRRYRLSEKEVILQATSFIFDVSVCEMFRWIPAGGKLCLMLPGGEKDPEQIVNTIGRNKVTTADFVPSLLSTLLDYSSGQNILKELSSLRWVFTGVEVVGISLVKQFNETLYKVNQTRLINAYGPTETTVDVTYFDCSNIGNDDLVPIGRPMANVQIYILTRYGAAQPVGVYGELCIAGKGLARGYLNNPELTSQKFQIPNSKSQITNKKMPSEHPMQSCNHASMQYNSLPPHHPIISLSHYPIYMTGDLARWLPDGNIEFLGRIDQQVKIRGFRVELGEIESQLLKYKEIKDVVVTARNMTSAGSSANRAEEKYLCAYFVSDEKIEESVLKDKLAAELPEYMIPLYMMQLDKIPLTPGGNVDRSVLPEPKSGVIGIEYTAPVDPLEEKLVSIWSDVLNIEKKVIGTCYNFFELGGHSLKAILLITRIHKAFNVKVPLVELFKKPTLRAMGEYIKQTGEERYASIKPAEKRDYYTLSSAQKRLYILHQLEPDSASYNMSTALQLEGILDKSRLEQTFVALIRRLESLRTSFELEDDQPVQKVCDEVAFEIAYYDVEQREKSKRRRGKEEIIKDFIRPFDLSQAPLLRVTLVKLSPKKHLLLVDMHHIICDGLSTGIIMKEFSKLYKREELHGLRIQYKDYAIWLQKMHETDTFKQKEAYWLEIFKEEIPVLNIPTDYPRPSFPGYRGDEISSGLGKELSLKVHNFIKETDVTLFMLFLAAYYVLLSKYSGQEDIVVGSPIAGRTYVDLEDIVGLFVNMLAIRNHPVREKTFKKFLEEVKVNMVNIYENQDYQFEELVSKLNVNRGSGRYPLFDVGFTFHNKAAEKTKINDLNELELNALKFVPYKLEHKVTPYDLYLSLIETDEGINMVLLYSAVLFKKTTVKNILKHYIEIVNQIVENVNIKLEDIKISHDLVAMRSNITDDQRDFVF